MLLCVVYPMHFCPDRPMLSSLNITAFTRDISSFSILALSLLTAAMCRLWMWLRYKSFAVWPCDDVLDNITIYTSMLSLLWAHWVVSRFLGDVYCRLKLDNEGLTILHRFVVHAPSFKFLQRYDDIIDRQIKARI